jgi:hypothetical protein
MRVRPNVADHIEAEVSATPAGPKSIFDAAGYGATSVRLPYSIRSESRRRPRFRRQVGVAFHYLRDNFSSFFSRINPSQTFTSTAASQHNSVRELIEDPSGLAAELKPKTFLQGSYKQSTAIDTINDVDIVVLCQELSIGGGDGPGGRQWSRNAIFDTIAAPLKNSWMYADKIRYGPMSMCIKIDLTIKIEIMPVVFKAGITDPNAEPFALFRPETQKWEDGFARYHQQWLTIKNKDTQNNFIPMVKVLKHLRSLNGLDAVSFHLECLLYRLPNEVFFGEPADYIPAVLEEIAKTNALTRAILGIQTPCNDRNILSSEWGFSDFSMFHDFVSLWALKARRASLLLERADAISKWQEVLGAEYFPAYSGLGGLGGLGFGGLGST